MVAQDGEHHFSRGSAVGRFWLARCTGFRVFAGRRELGTVFEIGFASYEGDVDALVVAQGLRRRIIPIERVLEIDPWSETIAVARRRTDRRRRSVAAAGSAAQVASSALSRYGRAAAGAILVGTAAAAHGAADAVTWAAPRVRRLALLAARVVATAVFVAFIALGLVLRLAIGALTALGRHVVQAVRTLRAAIAEAANPPARGPKTHGASRSTSRRRPV